MKQLCWLLPFLAFFHTQTQAQPISPQEQISPQYRINLEQADPLPATTNPSQALPAVEPERVPSLDVQIKQWEKTSSMLAEQIRIYKALPNTESNKAYLQKYEKSYSDALLILQQLKSQPITPSKP
jgi:hypothetical protein